MQHFAPTGGRRMFRVQFTPNPMGKTSVFYIPAHRAVVEGEWLLLVDHNHGVVGGAPKELIAYFESEEESNGEKDEQRCCGARQGAGHETVGGPPEVGGQDADSGG